MNDTQTDVSQGLGGAFTRLFSLMTIFIGYKALTVPGEMGLNTQQALSMGIALMALGAHSVLTNPAGVGLLRRLLCYLSGVAGVTVTLNVIIQLAGQ